MENKYFKYKQKYIKLKGGATQDAEATGAEATGAEATGAEATGDEATGAEATGDEATYTQIEEFDRYVEVTFPGKIIQEIYFNNDGGKKVSKTLGVITKIDDKYCFRKIRDSNLELIGKELNLDSGIKLNSIMLDTNLKSISTKRKKLLDPPPTETQYWFYYKSS